MSLAIETETESSVWQPLIAEVERQQCLFEAETGRTVAAYAAQGGRIACGRGCRNCCNLAVQCSFTEALRVAAALPDGEVDGLESHVARLRRHLVGSVDLKTYLRRHRQCIGDCPFLASDGACSVYAARPLACRSLLSTRPADWCAVDFAELHPLEKQAYLSSLDPDVVAWPTHYLAAARDLGQELETAALRRMRETFGFALSGSLPLLVWLEKNCRLSEVVARGQVATLALLEKEGLALPFLLHLDPP